MGVLVEWLTKESFCNVNNAINSDAKLAEFEKLMTTGIEKICPSKVIKISSLDKKWVNDKMKKISRAKKREYCKKGKSSHYKELDEKYRIEKTK